MHAVVGLCDVVLSHEIWSNSISELSPHNEIYWKVQSIVYGQTLTRNISKVHEPNSSGLGGVAMQ